MKFFSVFMLLVFSAAAGISQTYEVGVYAGGSNFIGDVGNSSYIAPNALVFGGIAKWNRSPRHAFRASILYANLDASDLDSDDSRRQQRGYSFTGSLIEGSVGIEYNFWDFDMHQSFDKPHTPYLYTGFTYFYHDSFALDPAEDALVRTDSEWDMSIPMVIGYKAYVGSSIVLALELGARYTFTDNLDGNYPGTEEYNFASFGNINNKDWYMFSGITVTYTFGRQPCYCGF